MHEHFGLSGNECMSSGASASGFGYVIMAAFKVTFFCLLFILGRHSFFYWKSQAYNCGDPYDLSYAIEDFKLRAEVGIELASKAAKRSHSAYFYDMIKKVEQEQYQMKANGIACTACSEGGTTSNSASTTSAQCIPQAGFYQVHPGPEEANDHDDNFMEAEELKQVLTVTNARLPKKHQYSDEALEKMLERLDEWGVSQVSQLKQMEREDWELAKVSLGFRCELKTVLETSGNVAAGPTALVREDSTPTIQQIDEPLDVGRGVGSTSPSRISMLRKLPRPLGNRAVEKGGLTRGVQG